MSTLLDAMTPGKIDAQAQSFTAGSRSAAAEQAAIYRVAYTQLWRACERLRSELLKATDELAAATGRALAAEAELESLGCLRWLAMDRPDVLPIDRALTLPTPKGGGFSIQRHLPLLERSYCVSTSV